MSASLLLLQSHLHHQLPRLPQELRPACQQPLLQRQPSSPRSGPQTGAGGTDPHTHTNNGTQSGTHTMCACTCLFILTHQSDHCCVLKIVFFFGQMKTKSACAAKRFHLFSVEISLFQWNETKNQFP